MDIKDVENLARLARIELSESEMQGLLKDMEGILGYVKQIQEAKVDDVELKHDLVNAWREDLREEGASQNPGELLIEQFPDSQPGFLKVKKIL